MARSQLFMCISAYIYGPKKKDSKYTLNHLSAERSLR